MAFASIPRLVVLGALAITIGASFSVAEQLPVGGAEPGCLLSGRIIGPSEAPIPGATVLLQPQGLLVDTGSRGKFCFAEVPAGARTIEVVADGFHLLSTRLPAAEDRLALVLRLRAIYLQEVVVTGTRTARRLIDSPVRIEVVTREGIEKTSSRTLADAVEFTPGVRVESNCQNCNFSQLRLLGLDGAYSQILIDGQAMMSSLAAVYGIEHIPARFIERLEIVKGGGSALYGPGAVGGVVNVIPHEPERGGGTLESRVAWTDGKPGNTLDGAWDWISDDRDLTLTLFAQRDEVAAVDLSGDGFTEVSRRDLTAYGARLNRYSSGRDAKLTVDFSHTSEDRRGGNKLSLPPDQADVAEAIDSTRSSLGVSYWRRHGNAFDYRLTAAYADTSRDTYYGSGRDSAAYGQTENPLLVLDSQFNHHRDKTTWTWGFQYSRDELEDRQPAYDRYIDVAYSNLGAYFQSEWRLSKRWELVTGLRVDDFSELDTPVVSPRMAAMVRIAPGVRLRASLASGFRGPQTFDEDLHITQVGGEGQIIRNDPSLKEESSLSSALGVEWLPVLTGGEARFEINAFHTRISDIFNVALSDDPLTQNQLEFTRSNAGSARIYGLEFGAGLALGQRFQFDAGFVVQRARFGTPEPEFGSSDFFRTPEIYGSATITWMPNKYYRVFTGLVFTGSMEVPHYEGYVEEDRLETTPEFLTIDVSVSRRFDIGESGSALELSVGCKNLGDEYQQDLDQGEFRDSGYVYGPRFPRRVFASLRYDF